MRRCVSKGRAVARLSSPRTFGALPLTQAAASPAIDHRSTHEPAGTADEQAHEECADDPGRARAVRRGWSAAMGALPYRWVVVSASAVVLGAAMISATAAMISATVGAASVPVASTETSTSVLRERSPRNE